MSNNYGGVRSGMARPGRRSPSREGRSAGEVLFNVLGVTLLVLALVAVSSGLWVAWAVRSSLGELEVAQHRQAELRQERRELSQQRDELQSRERIEAAAAELGLYPPRADQIKR